MFTAEINGRPATSDDLRTLAFSGYGYYTSLEVRDRKVRGLDFHLCRLRDSAEEVFGQPLDAERVREYLRHAIRETPRDVSVRINVFSFDTRAVWSGEAIEADILIRVSPPNSPDPTPVRVKSVVFQRFLPHLKNVATMGLAYYTRQARQAGCDDVLFVDAGGFVSEGSVWNIAFFDGGDIVWPSAPALPGIAKLVAQRGLTLLGIPSRTEPIHVSDVGSFQAAALMSSITAGQPIAAIDDVHFSQDQGESLVRLLHRAQEATPMEVI
jgi:branched-subunit amino acid aminotransferase/4-amino-4-deoxychorismate lyase